jgi:hypothetical protein
MPEWDIGWIAIRRITAECGTTSIGVSEEEKAADRAACFVSAW